MMSDCSKLSQMEYKTRDDLFKNVDQLGNVQENKI